MLTQLKHRVKEPLRRRRTPPAIPSFSDLVTDDFLRDLAQRDPAMDRGEITEEKAAQICMTLSDMAGELLARRTLERMGWQT